MTGPEVSRVNSGAPLPMQVSATQLPATQLPATPAPEVRDFLLRQVVPPVTEFRPGKKNPFPITPPVPLQKSIALRQDGVNNHLRLGWTLVVWGVSHLAVNVGVGAGGHDKNESWVPMVLPSILAGLYLTASLTRFPLNYVPPHLDCESSFHRERTDSSLV
jgi:hypothetical protein